MSPLLTSAVALAAATGGAAVSAGSLQLASGRDIDGARYLPTTRGRALTAGVAGLTCAGLALRIGPVAALPAMLYLTSVIVALAAVDLATMRLPDILTLPSYGVLAALLVTAAIVGHEPGALLRALAAMAVLLLTYLGLALLRPGGLGLGDVKLAGILGLVLGWQSWASVVIGTFLAFGLATVVGAGLVLAGRADRRTLLPFGPAMVGGALMALASADPIAQTYLSLLQR